MTRIFPTLKLTTWASLVLLLSLGLGACSKDDLKGKVTPQKSQDERKNKAHGTPVKAVLTLYDGHLHGIKGFHQNADVEGLKSIKRTQTMVLKYMDTGKKDDNGRAIHSWTTSPEGTDKFRVLYGVYHGKDKDYPDKLISTYSLVYGLTIRYYDADDQDITYQFVTNGQENIHQHFFIPYNLKPFYNDITWESADVIARKPPYNEILAKRFVTGEDDLPREDWKPFYYFYSDTNPWDKSYKASITGRNDGVEFLGFDNPVGMKGWLGFNNPIFDQVAYKHLKHCIYYQFDLGVELLHAATSKTSRNEGGKPSPFDMPSDAQRQSDLWDVHLTAPVIIYGSQEDGLYIKAIEIDDPQHPGEKKTVRNLRQLGRKPTFDELRDYSQDFVLRAAKAYGISKEAVIDDLYLSATADPKKKESGTLFF